MVIVLPMLVYGQFKVVDMDAPLLGSDETEVDVEVNLADTLVFDTVHVYVFDLLKAGGHSQTLTADSLGHYHYGFRAGSTVAVRLIYGNEHESYFIADPGERVCVSLDLTEFSPTLRWQFSGNHSGFNNELTSIESDSRSNTVYNKVTSHWKEYVEEGDEFNFKQDVMYLQKSLESRIKLLEVSDEVRSFVYLCSRLYYIELLSGYAMSQKHLYLQRGMDRDVGSQFWDDIRGIDIFHYNSLLYSPFGSRLKGMVTVCNEQRGCKFSYPKFLDKTNYARKGLELIGRGDLLNEKQLGAISEKTPELADLVVSLNDELRARKLEELRNPMYHIRYIDDDLRGRHVFDGIMENYDSTLVVMDFWATWCMPCRLAHEQSKELRESYKDRVQFVYVTGETSGEETWRQMISEIKGEHYYLTDDQWNGLCKHLKINSIPSYLLIGRDGEIKKRFTGFPGVDVMRGALETLVVGQ